MSGPVRLKASWQGDALACRLMIRHPMQVPVLDQNGQTIEGARVIQRITVSLAGAVVFRARMQTGIAENPFFAFTLPSSGRPAGHNKPFKFRIDWVDNDGVAHFSEVEISP